MWKKPFENTVGKVGNAGIQHFLLFEHIFFYLSEITLIICATSNLSSTNIFHLVLSKILSRDKLSSTLMLRRAKNV